MLFVTGLTNAQEFKTEERSVIGVFQADNKNKTEIFSSINKWVSINYNSSKNVIQMNDLESGTIIIKGINEITYKNTTKVLYPKMKNIPENTTTKFNHLIEINIKDNKYRIIYKISDIAEEDYGFNNLILNCIRFDDTNNNSIDEFNLQMDSNLKKALIGEEKRDLFISMTKPMFDEISSNLISDLKLTMKLIEKSVLNSEKDDW